MGDFFDTLASTKVFDSGKFFKNPGKYRFQVSKLLYLKDARAGETFVAEGKIVRSQATGDKRLEYNEKEGRMDEIAVDPHPVGDERSMVVVLDKSNESTYSNVLKFFLGLTGQPAKLIAAEDDPARGVKKGDELPGVSGAQMREMCSEHQPCAGWLVDVTIYDTQQKKNPKKAFTNLKWTPVEPELRLGANLAVPATPATTPAA